VPVPYPQELVDSDVRLVRAAASWLSGAQTKLKAARELDARAVPEAEKGWEDAERTVKRAGLTIGVDSRKRPCNVSLDAVTVSFKMDVTGSAGNGPTQPPAWYRIGSAAAHSSSWLIEQASSVDENGRRSLLADPETITAVTLAVLGSLEDLTSTLGTYHGRAPATAIQTLRRRAVAVIDRRRRWERQMKADAQALFGST
jgi:hypothetical protein